MWCYQLSASSRAMRASSIRWRDGGTYGSGCKTTGHLIFISRFTALACVVCRDFAARTLIFSAWIDSGRTYGGSINITTTWHATQRRRTRHFPSSIVFLCRAYIAPPHEHVIIKRTQERMRPLSPAQQIGVPLARLARSGGALSVYWRVGAIAGNEPSSALCR